MQHKRTNRGVWYRLGLLVVVLMTCLLAAAGVTYARYQITESRSVTLQAQDPSYVYLGSLLDGNFAPGVGRWTLNADGQQQLDFVIGNSSLTEVAQEDQTARIRAIVSLGAWDGEEDLNLVLTAPVPNTDPIEYQVVKATATRISGQSPLYATFGEGWVFRFFGSDGEELSWPLEGGTLSVVSMYMTVEYADLLDTSLIQLQLIGE